MHQVTTCLLLLSSLVQSSPYPTLTHDPKRPKYKGPFSMDYRERRSHARGVYPTQYTSLMGTERIKQEEETETSNTRVVRNLEESPYHRLE